jgi:hypothetical protein
VLNYTTVCYKTKNLNKRFSRPYLTSEPKVKAYIPFYEPLEVVKCKKCDQVIAEPEVLIRICRSDLDAR